MKSMKCLLILVLCVGFGTVCSSPVFANWTTGFEASEGFTAETTVDGVNGWVWDSSQGSIYRGKSTIVEIPAPTGDMSLRVWNLGTPHTAFSRMLSSTEQVGGIGTPWTGYVGFKMAIGASIAGHGFVTIGDPDKPPGYGSQGIYVGVLDDKFAYWSGSWTKTAQSYTPRVFYNYDIVVHGNGGGGGTWDLTISGGDLASPIVNTGLTLRTDYVLYLDGVRVQSNRTGDDFPAGALFVDDMYITPEPATIVLLAGGLAGMALRRRNK